MRGAREHFESRNLASFAEFSVSKIGFKKLSSAFEAESFDLFYSQAGFKRGETIMVKVFKHFEVNIDAKGNPVLQLFLHSEENSTKKLVEGVIFTPETTVENLILFVRREARKLDAYFIKNKTGNYSMHTISKHDAGYGQKVREEIEFLKTKGIVLL